MSIKLPVTPDLFHLSKLSRYSMQLIYFLILFRCGEVLDFVRRWKLGWGACNGRVHWVVACRCWNRGSSFWKIQSAGLCPARWAGPLCGGDGQAWRQPLGSVRMACAFGSSSSDVWFANTFSRSWIAFSHQSAGSELWRPDIFGFDKVQLHNFAFIASFDVLSKKWLHLVLWKLRPVSPLRFCAFCSSGSRCFCLSPMLSWFGCMVWGKDVRSFAHGCPVVQHHLPRRLCFPSWTSSSWEVKGPAHEGLFLDSVSGLWIHVPFYQNHAVLIIVAL